MLTADEMRIIPADKWPLLVYDFEAKHYCCFDNTTEGAIIRYKLLDNNIFNFGEMVSFKDKQVVWSKAKVPYKTGVKNALSLKKTMLFEKNAVLNQKKSMLLDLYSQFFQALSPAEKERLQEKYNQYNELSIKNILALSDTLSETLEFQKNEDIPLLLAHLYKEATPSQFCAMVVTSLKHNSPEALLETGMLGYFYTQNKSSSENITAAYEALEQLYRLEPQCFSKGGEFLGFVKRYYSESQAWTFCKTALDNSVQLSPLQKAKDQITEPPTYTEPPLSISILSIENSRKLYDYFGVDFLKVLLSPKNDLCMSSSYVFIRLPVDTQLGMIKQLLNANDVSDEDKWVSFFGIERIGEALCDLEYKQDWQYFFFALLFNWRITRYILNFDKKTI